MKNVFEPQRVQAICLDIDGTLVDTDDAYVQRLAHALRPLSFLYQEEGRIALARRLVMAAETPTIRIMVSTVIIACRVDIIWSFI